MGDGFKRIVVTPPEEDEVIVAGAVEAPDAAPNPAPDAAPDDASDPAPLPASAPASRRPQPASAEEGYHETTLEDLEGTKMPLAQRIVIVAAIICIIGALIYYFVAMR